jgi:Histidine kinase-, DNA gyrase B-, and HSP90-like ATPase
MTNLTFRLGLEAIQSYKRLSYTHWHALAEFVDNSTQSYFNHRKKLDAAYGEEGEKLRVDVVYDRNSDLIRVADNAFGMDRAELDYALEVGAPPANTDGRSKYGMGMKTAACWLGNRWTVRTKKLGETVEYSVEVDVGAVAAGTKDLPTRELTQQDPNAHYTILEVAELNRPPHGKTLGKIREFLSSMYRQDLRDEVLCLTWQGKELSWEFSDDVFAKMRDGRPYKKTFAFEVDKKKVGGWIGILDRGSRAKAGFSILHGGRVVKGWPESWRPQTIYGQVLGSNDLINQRVIGELELDDFDVSHTKDDILWFGDELDLVEEKLKAEAADYVAVAKQRRKGDKVATGPSELEIRAAIDELEHELTSSELMDLITVEDVPPAEAVHESIAPLLERVSATDPDFHATLNQLGVKGYTANDMSPFDPYVAVDATSGNEVIVVVNMCHPHVSQLVGSEGVLNYLRHCVYDAIAEWQARQRQATPEPDTIKMLKDRLLRVALEIEMHEPVEQAMIA